MSTTTTNPIPVPVPVPVAKPRRRKPGHAVRISCVPWEMYEELTAVFAEKPTVRMTYDNEELEIMVPSFEHDADADILVELIRILTVEFGLPIRRGGSTTLKRQSLLKGLEPDRCFWIANASRLAGVRKLDLTVHPPPDLAIEVDVSRSSLNRFKIYAALGIPELWRLAGDDLHFHVRVGKTYTEVPTTPTFAGITPAELMVFVIQARGIADQNFTTQAFTAWLKQRIAAAANPPAAPPPPSIP